MTIFFNFTDDYQFATRLYLENKLLEMVTEPKLLGTIVTSDLKWTGNKKMLVSKGHKRMIILKKLSNFNPPKEDLISIYKIYIRSILEQKHQLWHHSLCYEDIAEVERVQKEAFKIIFLLSCLTETKSWILVWKVQQPLTQICKEVSEASKTRRYVPEEPRKQIST